MFVPVVTTIREVGASDAAANGPGSIVIEIAGATVRAQRGCAFKPLEPPIPLGDEYRARGPIRSDNEQSPLCWLASCLVDCCHVKPHLRGVFRLVCFEFATRFEVDDLPSVEPRTFLAKGQVNNSLDECTVFAL
jgi:hypothetical protein